jgi:hypothetical protein
LLPRQQRLKASSRAAWAQIITAQLLDQLLVAVNEALSSFDLGLGWETLATLADELKSSRILFACLFAWPCLLIATEVSFRFPYAKLSRYRKRVAFARMRELWQEGEENRGA